jgi:hypothetical protein
MPLGRAVPPDEAERIAAVRRLDVLDTPPDEALDRIAALAAALFDVPFAVISIVDTDRIWFKARHGLDATQIDRGPGLCASAILGDGPYVVSDAAADPFARENALVTGEFGLRFYAGVPLASHDGLNIGTLCVMDTRPRPVTGHELRVLTYLATEVVRVLEGRTGTPRRTSGVDTEHARIGALLGVYVVGACDTRTAASVRGHLAVCRDCAAEVEAMREAASWIGGVEAVEPPPDLRRRIVERLGRDPGEPS